MSEHDLKTLAAARRRIAFQLSAMMVVIYFGYLALIAFHKELLGRLIAPGLSYAIVLGALVIVSCWALTWIYVRWANAHYDPTLDRIRRGE